MSIRNKVRVLNVNSVLDGELGGGTAERTIRLSEHLAMRSYDVAILSLNIGNDIHIKGVNIILIPCLYNRFFIPNPVYFLKIFASVKNCDIIHIMGHWSLLNFFVFICAKILKRSYIFCPAGSLKILGRSQILKFFYEKTIGNLIVKNASFIISITPDEGDYFKYIGIPDFKIKLIPNGVDRPIYDIKNLNFESIALPEKYILFMGRIDFIKGADLLLDGYLKIKNNFPDICLVFAGPDNGLKHELDKKINSLNLTDKIFFTGYVSGVLKSHLYHKSQFLVVPSRSEAMSIVALEAGVHGRVALLTTACGLHEISSISKDLEVDASAGSIATGLSKLLSDKNMLDRYSDLWSKYVIQSYTWDGLIAVYEVLFNDVLMNSKS